MSSELKPEQCDAMRTLLKSARLLYANMVGCCENHHQIDHAQQGLPGWLIDCLRDIELAGPAIDTLESTVSEQAAEIERLREALEQIERWSGAYPLDIFPEPDFQKAHELLKAGGMTLDAVSASCMRRVVDSVGDIARTALQGENSHDGN